MVFGFIDPQCCSSTLCLLIYFLSQNFVSARDFNLSSAIDGLRSSNLQPGLGEQPINDDTMTH